MANLLADSNLGRVVCEFDDGAGGPIITFRDTQPPDTALPSAVDASSGNWFGFSISASYYCDF